MNASKIFLFITLSILPCLAFSETLFEGYYRIETKGKHVGFAVVRVDKNPKTKGGTFKYFLRTSDLDHAVHQIMLTENFDRDLRPLQYEIEETTDDQPAKVSVSFEKSGLYIARYQSKTLKHDRKSGELPEGAFLSEEIGQVLSSMKPVKGNVYKYHAVNESKTVVVDGQVRVLDQTRIHGMTVYRFFDDFNVPPEESWIAENGQTLEVLAPDRGVTAVLVSDADQAIGQLEFNRSELTKLFGEIPKGIKNLVANKKISLERPLFTSKYDTSYKRRSNSIPLTVPKRWRAAE